MKQILVIEDEPSIRAIVQDVLEDEAFRVLSAENGQEGLILAQEHPIDLVLCDVMMPEMDGYAVLKELRTLPMGSTTPFIFLTAKADKPDVRYAMELGADDYLTKPFTRSELLKAVHSRLEKQAHVRQHFNQKIDDFRTHISSALPHELLTPLNGMIGLSEYLKESYASVQPEEILEMADLISQSARRLTRVIQNTLLYARLHVVLQEQERVKVIDQQATLEPTQIIQFAAQKITRSQGRTQDLSLELEDAAVAIPITNLEKLVEELVDNACKFSEEGTPIQVAGQVKADRYELIVTDRGRGMTPEQVANIGAYMQFERRLYEQQGSGLGLVIVRQLTQLYQGQITIESQPNHFTQVVISLPLTNTPTIPAFELG